MTTTTRLAMAAMAGILAGVACGRPPAAKNPVNDSATTAGATSDKNGCGNHPPGQCGAVADASPAAPAKEAPTCQLLARKCHPFDAASPTAHACHELGHESTNDAECQAKKAECIAACGGDSASP